MSKVLILTESRDAHANFVEKRLNERNIDIVRLDTDTFLNQNGGISLSVNNGQNSSYIQIDDCITLLSDISSVWYRRPQKIQSTIQNRAQSLFSEREFDECLRGLQYGLSTAMWVNDPEAIRIANNKYRQLHEAINLGFRIPVTKITNIPSEVSELAERCNNGGVIYKTLFRPCMEDADGIVVGGIPTTMLTPCLLSQIQLIRSSSGIFQEYLHKDYEIRVTIIGNQVFSAKILSQSETETTDWRTGVLLGNIKVEPYQLPEEIQNKCLLLLQKFNLIFGAIDLIKTPDGEYVFLEINPNGQWYWVEHLTKMPLVAAMTDLLCRDV